MEFPRFTRDDVLGWILACEQYFQLDETPEGWKVTTASLYLDEQAFQWHQTFERSWEGKALSWPGYVEAIKNRFGPSYEAPVEDSMRLQQHDSLTATLSEVQSLARLQELNKQDIAEAKSREKMTCSSNLWGSTSVANSQDRWRNTKTPLGFQHQKGRGTIMLKNPFIFVYETAQATQSSLVRDELEMEVQKATNKQLLHVRWRLELHASTPIFLSPPVFSSLLPIMPSLNHLKSQNLSQLQCLDRTYETAKTSICKVYRPLDQDLDKWLYVTQVEKPTRQLAHISLKLQWTCLGVLMRFCTRGSMGFQKTRAFGHVSSRKYCTCRSLTGLWVTAVVYVEKSMEQLILLWRDPQKWYQLLKVRKKMGQAGVAAWAQVIL